MRSSRSCLATTKWVWGYLWLCETLPHKPTPKPPAVLCLEKKNHLSELEKTFDLQKGIKGDSILAFYWKLAGRKYTRFVHVIFRSRPSLKRQKHKVCAHKNWICKSDVCLTEIHSLYERPGLWNLCRWQWQGPKHLNITVGLTMLLKVQNQTCPIDNGYFGLGLWLSKPGDWIQGLVHARQKHFTSELELKSL